MADTIRIKSGAVSEKRPAMPNLAESELGFRTDEKTLYVGTKLGNVKVGDAGWEERIKVLEAEIVSLRSYVDGLVAEINTRLDALSPSE